MITWCRSFKFVAVIIAIDDFDTRTTINAANITLASYRACAKAVVEVTTFADQSANIITTTYGAGVIAVIS